MSMIFLLMVVISEKLEQTIIRTAYRKLSRDEREKQLQPWDGGKAKQYTYVLVDTKAAPDNIEDNEENFIRFVKAIFYVGKGTIRLKPTSQKAATPTSQRALDHVRDADKNNLSEVSIIMR